MQRIRGGVTIAALLAGGAHAAFPAGNNQMWRNYYPNFSFARAAPDLVTLDTRFRRAIRKGKILDDRREVDRLAADLAARGEPILPFMLRLAGDRSFHPVRLVGGPCGIWFQFMKVDNPRFHEAGQVIGRLRDPRAIPVLRRLLGEKDLHDEALAALFGMHAEFTVAEWTAMLERRLTLYWPGAVESVATLPPADRLVIMKFWFDDPWIACNPAEVAGVKEEEALLARIVALAADCADLTLFHRMCEVEGALADAVEERQTPRVKALFRFLPPRAPADAARLRVLFAVTLDPLALRLNQHPCNQGGGLDGR